MKAFFFIQEIGLPGLLQISYRYFTVTQAEENFQHVISKAQEQMAYFSSDGWFERVCIGDNETLSIM